MTQPIPPGPTGTETPTDGGTGTTTPPTEPADGKLMVTQDQLDAIIQKRLAAERKRHADELEVERAKLGKTENEKLAIERDAMKKQLDEARIEAGRELAEAEARAAALAAGIKPERVVAATALAKLDDAVSADGKVDKEKIKAALAKVAADYPEWKTGAPAAGTTTTDGTQPNGQAGTPAANAARSGGEAPAGGAPMPTLAEFEAMEYTARVQLFNTNKPAYDQLQKQLDVKLRSGLPTN